MIMSTFDGLQGFAKARVGMGTSEWKHDGLLSMQRDPSMQSIAIETCRWCLALLSGVAMSSSSRRSSIY